MSARALRNLDAASVCPRTDHGGLDELRTGRQATNNPALILKSEEALLRFLDDVPADSSRREGAARPPAGAAIAKRTTTAARNIDVPLRRSN